MGEMFTESAGFKIRQQAFKESGTLPPGMSTGAVDVYQTKGTLLEGAGGGGGGLAAPVPQVIPGVVEKLFQPLSVATCCFPGRPAPTVSGSWLKVRPLPGLRAWRRPG